MNATIKRTGAMSASNLGWTLKVVLSGSIGAMMLTGCASVMKYSGDMEVTYQAIPVTSEPPGASVYVDGEAMGTTPILVRMPRWNPHDVRIELAGYRPRRRRLKNSLNPDMIWNALLIGGAPYGLAIDVVSGAWDDFLQPGEVHANLAPTSLRPTAWPAGSFPTGEATPYLDAPAADRP